MRLHARKKMQEKYFSRPCNDKTPRCIVAKASPLQSERDLIMSAHTTGEVLLQACMRGGPCGNMKGFLFPAPFPTPSQAPPSHDEKITSFLLLCEEAWFCFVQK
jgi:hypothetical protein